MPDSDSFMPPPRGRGAVSYTHLVVLLTNDGILPLDASKAMRVLVTGTNADNQTILGDWALPQPEDCLLYTSQSVVHHIYADYQ